MLPKLTIVTGNELKFIQIAHALREYFNCEKGIFETYEIQGTPEEILHDKLLRAYDYFKTPVLVDDTSLHLDSLNGFPGSYIRDFLQCMRPYEMGKKFAGTRMKVISRIGLMKSPEDFILGEGVVEGVVSDPKDRDPGLREFELFFQPDGLDRPMIDFEPTEVLSFSHRGKALQNLVEKLK